MRDREYSGISAMTDNIRNRRKDGEELEAMERCSHASALRGVSGRGTLSLEGQLNAP